MLLISQLHSNVIHGVLSAHWFLRSPHIRLLLVPTLSFRLMLTEGVWYSRAHVHPSFHACFQAVLSLSFKDDRVGGLPSFLLQLSHLVPQVTLWSLLGDLECRQNLFLLVAYPLLRNQV